MRWRNPFQWPFGNFRLPGYRRMGPDPEGPWKGTMSPPPPKIKPGAHEAIPQEYHGCDACGRSKVDGAHLSRAKFAVTVGQRVLHLCGHHFRKHRGHIHERAYEVHDHA